MNFETITQINPYFHKFQGLLVLEKSWQSFSSWTPGFPVSKLASCLISVIQYDINSFVRILSLIHI